MLLHPAQKLVVKNKARFKVLVAGRRFGKTVLATEIMVFTAVSKKDARVVYIAPTFQSARDIAFEQLRRRILKITHQINETRLEIEVCNKFKGISKIFLRSWDSVETLRGQAFDLIILDEVAQFDHFWTGWQEVLRPTLTDKKGKVLFISTPLGFNHLYDLNNTELTDKDFKSFHFTSWDNPHLDREELERAKETLPKDRYLQEYEASFQKTQGLAIPEFSREKHLYEVLSAGAGDKIAGIDFGYVNPAAIMEIYWNGEKLWVDDEWYKTSRTDAQIAEYVASCHYQSVYPDPENAAGIEELRRHDVNIREVKKGKGSIVEGINMIRELLLNKRLFINKRCVNLISELESYAYDEDKKSEVPIKENDHAIDALRYVVLSLFPKIDKQQKLMREIGRQQWETTQTNIQSNPV